MRERREPSRPWPAARRAHPSRRPVGIGSVPRLIGAALAVVLVVAALLVEAPAPADARTLPPGIQGVDVSNYQHAGGAAIDWPAVKGSGREFAYVKATEGAYNGFSAYTNPYFRSDFEGARAAGLYRGAYHFARPQLPLTTALDQAREFVGVAGVMHGPTDLPPVLDMEADDGASPATITAWMHIWLDEVERLTGRQPVIFSGYWFWNTFVQSSSFSNYRLWMARYTLAWVPDPLPVGWSTWTMWQFDAGTVPGITGLADLDVFCCDLGTLAALASGGTASATASNPFGSVDDIRRRPAGIEVWGWAIDPDVLDPIDIHIYVDGERTVVPASGTRNDVWYRLPFWGPQHGFATTIPVGPGDHRVCVYAINAGAGTANPLLTCRTVVGAPFGALDEATAPVAGSVAVRGWAIDPDTAAPVDVHVYLDGRRVAAIPADQERDDLAELFPESGSAHGFATTVADVAGGAHTVCAYAINQLSGDANPLLGCRSVVVADPSPFGALDLARAGGGAIDVSGWATDPDTGDPIDVHVYVDGVRRAEARADATRLDLAGVPRVAGVDHGYQVSVGGLAPGPHTVCTYGIDIGPGENRLLGCATSLVPTGAPVGAFDGLTRVGAHLRAVGWAVDPDTRASIPVHVYVDGTQVAEAVAGVDRPDVAAVVSPYGAPHGYDLLLDDAPAGSIVCVYAIDQLPGPGVTPSNTTLGCRAA